MLKNIKNVFFRLIKPYNSNWLKSLSSTNMIIFTIIFKASIKDYGLDLKPLILHIFTQKYKKII